MGGCAIGPALSCKGDTIASGAFPLQKAMVDSLAPVVAVAEGSRLTAWLSISAEPISTPSKALPRPTLRLSGSRFQKVSSSRDARNVTAKATEIVASKKQGSGYAAMQACSSRCRGAGNERVDFFTADGRTRSKTKKQLLTYRLSDARPSFFSKPFV
jgi:hypothetical protein